MSRWASPLERTVATHSRCCGESEVRASISERPMIAFIGVRSSWLIWARKALLAALAERAAASARRRSATSGQLGGALAHPRLELLGRFPQLVLAAGVAARQRRSRSRTPAADQAAGQDQQQRPPLPRSYQAGATWMASRAGCGLTRPSRLSASISSW